MPEPAARPRVLQMRLVVETTDYDEALAFYRDALGATEEMVVDGPDGERVTILDVGRATLELSNPAQVDMIDRVEVGRRVSPRLRVAFEVDDAAAVTRVLQDSGQPLSRSPPAPRGTRSTRASTLQPASRSRCSRSWRPRGDEPARARPSP